MASDELVMAAATHKGVIMELGALPPGTLLTVESLASIFKRSPDTIMRAANQEGWLPAPARMFGHAIWTNDQILAHVRELLEAAADEQNEKARKIRRLASS